MTDSKVLRPVQLGLSQVQGGIRDQVRNTGNPPTRLADLNDVGVQVGGVPPADGQAPVYNQTAGGFVYGAAGGERFDTIVVGSASSLDTTVSHYDYFCTGTNDETTIMSAITALPSTGGRIVLMDGTYNIQGPTVGNAAISTSKNNLHVVGMGPSTILSCTGASFSYRSCISMQGTDNVLSDLAIHCVGDGTNAFSGAGLGGNQSTISNVHVQGSSLGDNGTSAASGALSIAGNGSLILGCTVESWAASGTHFVVGIAVSGLFSLGQACRIFGLSGGGLSRAFEVSYHYARLDNCVANVPTAPNGGICLFGNNVSPASMQFAAVTNCSVIGASHHGIADYSTGGAINTDSIIQGNHVAGASASSANTYDGINLSSTRANVQHNTVRPNSTAGNKSTRYGINVTATSTNCLVTNNDLNAGGGTYGTGSYVDAGTGTVTTAGNRL